MKNLVNKQRNIFQIIFFILGLSRRPIRKQAARTSIRCSICCQGAGIRQSIEGVQTAVPLDHGPNEPAGRVALRARAEAQS